MLNKRLGIAMVILSILISFIILNVISNLNALSMESGCFPNTSECYRIENYFSIAHIAIGIIAFLFALGIYLIFFSKAEEAILKRLEDDKTKEIKEEKFNILLKALDSYEKKVMSIVKEQDGITQSTLRIRADMSKAKLSYVLTELERRGLIKRVQKGKTLAIFLKNI